MRWVALALAFASMAGAQAATGQTSSGPALPPVVTPQTPSGQPRVAPYLNAAVPPATSSPAAPAPAAETWLPCTGVDLVALDKVTARSTQLSARIGQDVQYGSLTIVARSCDVRPPGVSPDAAAFLEITDSRPGVAPFRGWMLKSAPSVSIYEHPVYDIRVVGCRL
jgi:hypothetical protein